jgi:YVTN family beta-propeller protein
VVTVINTNTYALTTISVESPTRGVAVGPDGTHVYVTNYYTGKVSVIAVATNNVETVRSVGSLPSVQSGVGRIGRIGSTTRCQR